MVLAAGGLELGGGQDREAEVLGHGLAGGQAQPIAAQQVPDGQAGRVGGGFFLALEGLEVEQAVGEFGVELAGLVGRSGAGVDEVFPLDDPVVGQGVELVEFAAEGGEGEQQSQVGRLVPWSPLRLKFRLKS